MNPGVQSNRRNDKPRWVPPADIDPEVVGLCAAMNACPGIFTVESCCGHGREPFRIWFMPQSLDDLPEMLWFFDACHSGQYGWQVRIYTDCAASHTTFVVEGPVGGYESAEAIAKCMRTEHAESRA